MNLIQVILLFYLKYNPNMQSLSFTLFEMTIHKSYDYICSNSIFIMNINLYEEEKWSLCIKEKYPRQEIFWLNKSRNIKPSLI